MKLGEKVMNLLGSKQIETERLILKPMTFHEQKYLWELLMIPEVNRYYLTIPKKFKEKLKDWNLQEKFYIEEIKHANDLDVFKWSIFLKGNKQCIGKISCHKRSDEDESVKDDNVRGVGWIIDPVYQDKGFGTEAAKAMIDYMFNEVKVNEIRTGAAIENPASWKIMEKLGFLRQKETKFIQYTYIDGLTEIYQYCLKKDDYLK